MVWAKHRGIDPTQSVAPGYHLAPRWDIKQFFVVLVLSETVLSETVLVLDGRLNRDAAARWSLRFAVTFGSMGRIAILDCFPYSSSVRRGGLRTSTGSNLV